MLKLLRQQRFKAVLREGVRQGRRWTPKRGHVVVAGWPDTEGNALEVIRWILVHRDERVVWLTSGATRHEALPLLAPCPDTSQLIVLPKRSFRGFTAYLCARVVFFTHGLYLSPLPGPGEVVVNLWHGDGPKQLRTNSRNRVPSSTYAVSGAALFGGRRVTTFGLPQDRLILSGNPRWDQLRRPLDDHQLRALGVDPSRPFLLFMPTFRSARAVGMKAAWEDRAETMAGRHPAVGVLEGLLSAAAGSPLQVVVKPHPLDVEDYTVHGALVMTDAELRVARVPPYRVLARSAALVTDYSSVWTDYLCLDRPIAFALADHDEYRRTRGLGISLVDVLPGPVLTGAKDCKRFVDAVMHDDGSLELLRRRSAELIGLVRTPCATADLFAELVRRKALPCSSHKDRRPTR